MKTFYIIYLLLACQSIITGLSAQTVSGKLVDEKNLSVIDYAIDEKNVKIIKKKKYLTIIAKMLFYYHVNVTFDRSKEYR